ncbi:MAG TPA: LysM domain-containing protein [Acidobacteriota bacterium]|nr:LysM domain-containing protein [Acidobacteriota bacterium]
MVSHKVRRGETLAGVASRYGVSIQEVAQHNRMSSKAELRNGQVIKVPVQKNEGSKYSVRSTKNSKHIAKSTPKGKASKGAKSSARRRR